MSYLPIADHGVIGNLHTAALVGVDGTIDWLTPAPAATTANNAIASRSRELP